MNPLTVESGRKAGLPDNAANVIRDGDGKRDRDRGREGRDADRERSEYLGNGVGYSDGSESEGDGDLGEHVCSKGRLREGSWLGLPGEGFRTLGELSKDALGLDGNHLHMLYTFRWMMPPNKTNAIFDEGAVMWLSRLDSIASAAAFGKAPQWLSGTAN